MRTYYLEKFQTLFLTTGLILVMIVLTVADGFAAADGVRQECLRLHVLANSDSVEDQDVKLMVRDALLEESAELFSESVNSVEAAAKVMENKEYLEEVANKVLAENDFSYSAQIGITQEYFPTRQYEDVTLPAGNYTALKVILGEGQGHNWWCVMFPPLCLPAVSENNEESVYGVFGENGGDLVTGKSGYIIKLRIVEIVENIIAAVRS